MKVTELKNMKINTWDGRIWYPTFYDLDTVLGIDNSGYLTIPSDVEIEAMELKYCKENLNILLAENCNKPYEEVVKDTDRNLYLHGIDAVKYEIADKVL